MTVGLRDRGSAFPQAGGAQQELDGEARVRVAELAAERAFQRPHPVPDRLRMDVQPLGHLGSGPVGLEPGAEGLSEPLALQGAQREQRTEPALRELVDQRLVGEQPELDEDVLAERDVAVVDDARPAQVERPPRILGSRHLDRARGPRDGRLSRLVSTSGLADRVSGNRTGRAESRDDATWC